MQSTHNISCVRRRAVQTCVPSAPALVDTVSHRLRNQCLTVTVPSYQCVNSLITLIYYLANDISKEIKMSDCSVCKKSTGQARHKIVCCDCKSHCHLNCVNLTKDDLDYFASEKQMWRCPPCSKLRKLSMSAQSGESDSSALLSEVIDKLNEASEDRKRIEAEINKSFDFVHEQVNEQKNVLKEQSAKLSEYLQLIENLRLENVNLKKKVAELELRLEDSEQYTRSNTVEIQGIPENKNEDVYEIVRQVGVALDMNFSREAIDVCHRLGKRPDSIRPAGIVVKFVRREVKQTMLEKRRVKRNLNTKDVGFTQTNAEPVYINESLSPAKRKLFAAARVLKREKGYTYLWVRNGKIFMRKSQGDPVIVISSQEQIEKL
jgi:hypothetical protein